VKTEELAQYNCRRLTEDEIRAIYPGVEVNLTPLTEEEQFERRQRNLKAQRNDYYRSVVGFRE
jgi:hypothetical protein